MIHVHGKMSSIKMDRQGSTCLTYLRRPYPKDRLQMYNRCPQSWRHFLADSSEWGQTFSLEEYMLIHIMYSLHLSINTYKSFAVEAYFQIISCPSNFFKLFFNLFIFFFGRGEGDTRPFFSSRRRRHRAWSDVQETKGPECMWEWGAWACGGCGCVCCSDVSCTRA